MICKICNCDHGHVEYDIREMMFGYRDMFTYFQCKSCGCIQIKEFPIAIEKYYGNKYCSFSLSSELDSSMKKYLKKQRDLYILNGSNFLGKITNKIYPLNFSVFNILKILRVKKMDKILDVGCGAGDLLHRLAVCGFKNLHGVDLFIEEDLQTNDGVSIFKSTIHGASDEYDFIMMNHSLEHMPDQLEVFNSIYKKLNQNGICLIRIPVVGYAWEKYKTNWFQLDAPRHYFIHTVKSMGILARKVGLNIDSIIYDSGPVQFIASEYYTKDVPLTEQKYSKRETMKYLNKAKELNEKQIGDQACFILRKNHHLGNE